MLDDFYPAEVPVVFSGGKSPTSFTFESGDKTQFLIAAWVPMADTDEAKSLKYDVCLRGLQAQKAWGIDIFNGT